ncbi:hypothetical protein Q5M85_03160 [Paraclostridium bifermentans]|nr:hypothetical protein [Paraclostridium bifermentans]
MQFSVKDYTRFIYVTYPADWASKIKLDLKTNIQILCR